MALLLWIYWNYLQLCKLHSPHRSKIVSAANCSAPSVSSIAGWTAVTGASASTFFASNDSASDTLQRHDIFLPLDTRSIRYSGSINNNSMTKVRLKLCNIDTRKVKVLSLPETIKEKWTFRAKALRRELVAPLLTPHEGPSLETLVFPLSFQVVR